MKLSLMISAIVGVLVASSAHCVTLPNSFGLGVGVSFPKAVKPVGRADYFFHFASGVGINSVLESVTSFDFGLPDAGSLDGNKRRLFLGTITQTARAGLSFFDEAWRLSVELGIGGYMTRHSQTRISQNGGGGTGARFGVHARLGVVTNWYPLINSVYQWNDLFVQFRGTLDEFFRSKVIRRNTCFLVAFGGSF